MTGPLSLGAVMKHPWYCPVHETSHPFFHSDRSLPSQFFFQPCLGRRGKKEQQSKCDSPNALRLKSHRQGTHLTSSAQALVTFVSGPDLSPDLKIPSLLP